MKKTLFISAVILCFLSSIVSSETVGYILNYPANIRPQYVSLLQELNFNIDYLYTNTSGQYTTIDPTDTGSKWVGYFVIEGVRETTGASDHVTFVALKAEWTGNFTLGADREGHEAITRDFFINNDAVGDILVYFG